VNAQITIRLDDDTNRKAIEQAQASGISRATLVRNSLNSYLDNKNPNENLEIIDLLKEQLANTNKQIDFANEAKSRSDTIIMQLTKQLEHSQLQLEDINRPKTLWQKLRTVFS